MNPFYSLRSLFGPKRTRQSRRGPLAKLSEGQRSVLLRLQESEEWVTYLSALDEYAKFRAEALLLPTAENPEFWRGYIAGLRAAAALPEQLRKEEGQKDVRERSREQSAADASRRRDIATYATPAWTDRQPRGS